jgi:hypothetical protein
MNQCEYVTEYGQCRQRALDGSRFCVNHSRRKEDEIQIGHYLVSKRLFGDAPVRHLEADDIKSLKTEIALLRTMVERRWNMLENDVEFVAAFPTMKDSFLALEKLVTSCHQMEVKLDLLISKQALLSLAQKIVGVIQDELPPELPARDEVVESIGNRIAEAIMEQQNG